MRGNVQQRSTRGQADFCGPVHVRAPELGDALTFQAYTVHVLETHKRTNLVRPVRVQVRKRGVVFCGRVVEASAGDWFKVDSYLGQLWFAGDNVRMCSGDGRCVCESELAEAGATARACAGGAPAFVVPLGNTGTTTGEGAR